MARSHKPIVWGLFAGGGTFAAFFTPIMIFVTGLAVPLGLLSPDDLGYDGVLAFAQNYIGKLLIFVAVCLPLWHAAHRLRVTAHDFGIGSDTLVAIVCYAVAMVLTIAAVVALLSI